MTDSIRGTGPLAGDGDIITGGPIDDPTLADRSNPRWADPTSPEPDAQPLTNPDGSPDVMPPERSHQLPGDPPHAASSLDDRGTPEDQAAQELPGDAEPGSDNIREGRGDSMPNPALAEGGDNG